MSKSTIKSLMQQFFYPTLSYHFSALSFPTNWIKEHLLQVVLIYQYVTASLEEQKHNSAENTIRNFNLVKVLGPFSWICQVTSMSLFSKRSQWKIKYRWLQQEYERTYLVVLLTMSKFCIRKWLLLQTSLSM